MNDFNSRQALDVVINRLRERSTQLFELVQQSIDEGKLVTERSELKVANNKGKKSNGEHVYERRMPLSDDEALAKIISVLQAHLVELPLCASSALTELSKSQIVSKKSSDLSVLPLFRDPEVADFQEENNVTVKEAVIERAHEGMLFQDAAFEPLQLSPFTTDELSERQENLDELASLLGVK